MCVQALLHVAIEESEVHDDCMPFLLWFITSGAMNFTNDITGIITL